MSNDNFIKRFCYKLINFKWHLVAAIKTFILRMKYPLYKLEGYNWSKDDHRHICIAVRLLNEKDFKDVCPHHGKIDYLEWGDDCDYCPYKTVVDFNTSENGKKYISLYIDKRISEVD